MADGVLSMFMSPEQYQQMQATQQQQKALQFAQLDPMQQAQYGLYLGGNQLGTALARGLGGEDRQLKLISQRQAISKDLDPSNPDSLLKGAQMAAQAGDQEFALNLAEYARKQQSEIALAQQRLREGKNAVAPDIQVAKYKGDLMNQIAALDGDTSPEGMAQKAALQRQLDALPVKGTESTNEIKNASEMALRAGLKPGTPEYDKAVAENLNKLTAKGGNVKEVGVAAGTREAVYIDPNTDAQFTYGKDKEGKQVRVPYFGGIDRTVSKTDVSMSNKVEGEVLQGLAKVDVKRFENTIAAADVARNSLTSLNELDKLTKEDLISGPYAGQFVGATNLLNQLGLLGKKDIEKLASSEIYQKSAKDLVLSGLQGKLGGGVSNSDIKFIEGIVPQLETSPEARKKLVAYLTQRNIRIINEAKDMEKVLRKDKSLENYEPKTIIPAAGNDVIRSQLEALKRERAAAAERERKK